MGLLPLFLNTAYLIVLLIQIILVAQQPFPCVHARLHVSARLCARVSQLLVVLLRFQGVFEPEVLLAEVVILHFQVGQLPSSVNSFQIFELC